MAIQRKTSDSTVKVALVQRHATPNRDENLERGIAAFKEAARKRAQLVVFAELAFQPFFPQKPRDLDTSPWAETIPGPTTDRFSQLAKHFGIVTVINLYEKDGACTYDSSPVIDAGGELLGTTRMLHIMDGPCFHERDYYTPGNTGAPVYLTAVGKLGVAICYDRHYPEYMRALGIKGAEIVVVPQAGAVDEWPPGLYEAELQVASMQNGYFCALANRVGKEECLMFAGESFVTDPFGQVICRAPKGKDSVLYADLDLSRIADSPARTHFMKDRRPDIYPL